MKNTRNAKQRNSDKHFDRDGRPYVTDGTHISTCLDCGFGANRDANRNALCNGHKAEAEAIDRRLAAFAALGIGGNN
jgi:hypothetical protein